MTVKLNASQKKLFVAAILQKHPGLPSSYFKKLGIVVGKEEFASIAMTGGNQSVVPPQSLTQAIQRFDTVMEVAKFCRDHLDNYTAYLEISGLALKVNDPHPESSLRQTPFHFAVNFNNIKQFDALLPFADVNKPNKNGYTPLMLACLNDGHKGNFSHIIDKLLERPELNLNAQSVEKWTALHMVVQRGNYVVAQKLLNQKLIKKKVDTNIVNQEGHTALQTSILHSSLYPEAADCARQLHANHRLSVTNSTEPNKNFLWGLLANKKYPLAHLALDCGADINVKFKNMPANMNNLFFMLLGDHLLTDEYKKFTDEDIPALEFFRDSGFDFSFIIDNDYSLDQLIITRLAVNRRVADLEFVAQYLGEQINCPPKINAIHIAHHSNGRVRTGIFTDYYSVEEQSLLFSNDYLFYEKSFAKLEESLKAIPSKPVIQVVDEEEKQTITEDKKVSPPPVLSREKPEQLIKDIINEIDKVKLHIQGTGKHIPKWVEQLSSQLETIKELETLKDYYRKISKWSENTLLLLAFSTGKNAQDTTSYEVINVEKSRKKFTAIYEGEHSFDSLSPIKLSEHLYLYVPENTAYLDGLNPEDSKKFKSLLERPRLAHKENDSGLKRLSRNQHFYSFKYDQVTMKREVVFEIKLTSTKARILCCEMEKEGDGPTMIVPVKALIKGLHTTESKLKESYSGPGFFNKKPETPNPIPQSPGVIP